MVSSSLWDDNLSSLVSFDEELENDLDDPAFANLKEEYFMARRALDMELEERRSILASLFRSQAKNTHMAIPSDGVADGAELGVSKAREGVGECPDVPSLWCYPPVAINEVPRRVLVIVNPKAGRRNGQAELREVKALFEKHGVVVTAKVSQFPGHGREIAGRALDRTICVLGGKGTVRDVVNGIMDRPDRDFMTLALLPIGVAGSLDLSLGISNPREGVERVLAGQVRLIDLMVFEDMSGSSACSHVPEGPRVEAQYSLVFCGWGFMAAMASGLKKLAFLGGGTAVKLSAAYQVIKKRKYTAALDVPDGEVPAELKSNLAMGMELSGVSVHNCRHLGNGNHAPQAQLDDGLLDAVLSGVVPGNKVLRLTKTYDASNEDWLVCSFQVSKLTITPTLKDESSHLVSIDGELLGSSPCQIRVVPRALRIYA